MALAASSQELAVTNQLPAQKKALESRVSELLSNQITTLIYATLTAVGTLIGVVYLPALTTSIVTIYSQSVSVAIVSLIIVCIGASLLYSAYSLYTTLGQMINQSSALIDFMALLREDDSATFEEAINAFVKAMRSEITSDAALNFKQCLLESSATKPMIMAYLNVLMHHVNNPRDAARMLRFFPNISGFSENEKQIEKACKVVSSILPFSQSMFNTEGLRFLEQNFPQNQEMKIYFSALLLLTSPELTVPEEIPASSYILARQVPDDIKKFLESIADDIKWPKGSQLFNIAKAKDVEFYSGILSAGLQHSNPEVQAKAIKFTEEYCRSKNFAISSIAVRVSLQEMPLLMTNPKFLSLFNSDNPQEQIKRNAALFCGTKELHDTFATSSFAHQRDFVIKTLALYPGLAALLRLKISASPVESKEALIGLSIFAAAESDTLNKEPFKVNIEKALNSIDLSGLDDVVETPQNKESLERLQNLKNSRQKYLANQLGASTLMHIGFGCLGYGGFVQKRQFGRIFHPDNKPEDCKKYFTSVFKAYDELSRAFKGR